MDKIITIVGSWVDPAFVRIDPHLDFRWTSESPISKSKDYVSIRWIGYLLPEFDEVYSFNVRVNDGARLWINGILLIDQFDNDLGESDESIMFTAEHPEPLVAEQLTEIKIEYRQNTGFAYLSLGWISHSELCFG